MKKLPIIYCVAILSTLISCQSSTNNNQPQNQTNPIPTEEAEVHEDENYTTLSDQQLKSIGIEFGSLEQKQLTQKLHANGVLRVPNQNRASVSSAYSGVIQSLRVQSGNYVSKGQTLATIFNPEFIQVQSDYLQIKNRIAFAEIELQRQQELNTGNAGALKNKQVAESELRTLKNSKSAFAQQIQLMGINPNTIKEGNLVSQIAIKSPISGIVSDVMVEMGSYVSMSTPVVKIVDNGHLHVDLHIYEKDLDKVKKNQIIHFIQTNNPGKEYDAQIVSLGSSFEDDSKAVSVHAEVKGQKDGLINGMSVTALISLANNTTTALPTDAIVNQGGTDFIFIVVDGEAAPHVHEAGDDHAHEKTTKFEKIPVHKGNSDIGYSEITLLKEIPKNAKIVIKGAFFIMAKMSNAGGDHAH